jgi:catechol 2,3-dioxygenase-like lactoylglutathione lyase family enzyme
VDARRADLAAPGDPAAAGTVGRPRYPAALIDHIGVEVADVDAAVAFYLRVFEPIGLKEALRFPYEDSFAVGLAGPDGVPDFWVSKAKGPETRELHVALRAADRSAVDAVHQAAVSAGVEVLNAPREWPQYHPGYYAVFLRDLDGHNVEAVYHGTPDQGTA